MLLLAGITLLMLTLMGCDELHSRFSLVLQSRIMMMIQLVKILLTAVPPVVGGTDTYFQNVVFITIIIISSSARAWRSYIPATVDKSLKTELLNCTNGLQFCFLLLSLSLFFIEACLCTVLFVA